MRVFFNFIVVQLVLTLYIFMRGWRVLPEKLFLKVLFLIVFLVELCAYFVGFFGSKSLSIEALHDIAWIGTSWAVFAMYTSLFLIIYDLLRFLRKKKGILASYDLERRRNKFVYYATSVILVLGMMCYGNYRFENPTVVEKKIEINKHSPNVNKLRIAVVSDIHAGFLINKKVLSNYIDHIMALTPDMILLVGDIIDYDIQSVKDQNLQEEFHRLQAPYGVYAVTGNHEYIDVDSTKNAKIDWLREESGLRLLQDTAILIEDSFYLVGREDNRCKTRKSLPTILKNVDKSLPIIVMNHQPHHLEEESEAGADIALYGHTHDGQLFPANLLISMLYEVGYGYKKKDNTHIYVSSGLGLAGPQYRIGTISEIVLLNVEFNK